MSTALQDVSFETETFNFQWRVTTDDQAFTGGVTIDTASPGELAGDTLTVKSATHTLEITNDMDDKRQMTVYLKASGGVQTVSLPPLSAEDWGKVKAAAGIETGGHRRRTPARKSRRRTTRRRR